MAVRLIDGNVLKQWCEKIIDQACHPATVQIGEAFLDKVRSMPTLTPPNETPPCYQPDGDGCAYQCYDGDDEPIDKCKECPLCYSDKQRHHAPPNEWVSVEERLPEDEARQYIEDDLDGIGYLYPCLLTYKSPNTERIHVVRFYYDIIQKWFVNNGEELCEKGRCIAWMPLPAPYDRRPPEVQS